MVFLVENGTGVQGANAQIPFEYVTAYLAERNRSTEGSWNTKTDAEKRACVIAATDFVEKRHGPRLLGVKQFAFDEEPAAATVTFTGVPSGGDTITIGGVVVPVAGLGADTAAVATAFAALLNPGDDQIAALTPLIRSAVADGSAVTIVAAATGEMGNYLTLAEATSGDVTLSGSTFSGGLDAGPQLTPFPRLGLTDRNGAAVVGIPRAVRDAICEYSVRAAVATLAPDPTVHASGRVVVESEQTVGPITERYKFEDGAALSQLIKPYPAADLLLAPFLSGAGSYR